MPAPGEGVGVDASSSQGNVPAGRTAQHAERGAAWQGRPQRQGQKMGMFLPTIRSWMREKIEKNQDYFLMKAQ